MRHLGVPLPVDRLPSQMCVLGKKCWGAQVRWWHHHFHRLSPKCATGCKSPPRLWPAPLPTGSHGAHTHTAHTAHTLLPSSHTHCPHTLSTVLTLFSGTATSALSPMPIDQQGQIQLETARRKFMMLLDCHLCNQGQHHSSALLWFGINSCSSEKVFFHTDQSAFHFRVSAGCFGFLKGSQPHCVFSN